MVTVIQKSRSGFLFQDLYCLNVILELLLNQGLKSFIVDYTFDESANRSVDLKLINISNEISIYEVKTGDNYKNNKEDSIIESLCTLYLYSLKEHSTSLTIYIVLDKSQGQIITDYLAFFEQSNQRADTPHLGTTTVGQKMKEVISKMQDYTKHNSSVKYLGRSNKEKIKSFLRLVKPKPFDGQIENIIDQNSMCIDKISQKLSLQQAPMHGLSDRGILLDLLFRLQQSVGNEVINEINNPFYKPLIESFCRRKLTQTSAVNNRNLSQDELIKTNTSKIKISLCNSFGLLDQQTVVSAVDVQEGGAAL